jgi:hypothetical protein
VAGGCGLHWWFESITAAADEIPEGRGSLAGHDLNSHTLTVGFEFGSVVRLAGIEPAAFRSGAAPGMVPSIGRYRTGRPTGSGGISY